MVYQEGGNPRNPDIQPDIQRESNGNVRLANPAEVMRDNPAALIVNKESYNRMAAYFSPDQFDAPQVVKVETFSSEHGVVVKDFVLDGMTRTKFVYDHQDEIAQNHPDFQLKIRDVTSASLQNTKIVPLEERVEGQKALTMLQYLRAVIPPTVEHTQIASDRIAAHLINGWENMVGEDIAKKYSALAALNLLSKLNISTDNILRRQLDRQPMMVREGFEERVKLMDKLVEMAKVIRQLGPVGVTEIPRSAFLLVGAESAVIGGEKEAKTQVWGLLTTPEVDRKLAEAFPDEIEREKNREQLGEFILGALKRVTREPNREEAINILGEALKDPKLGFNHVIDVFTAQNPVMRYDQVRMDVNRDRMAKAYQVSPRTSLNPTEAKLIDQVGAVTNLREYELPDLVKAIKTASTTFQRAEELKMQLIKRKDQYLSSGINPKTLEDALPAIEAAQQDMMQASFSNLNRLNQRLSDTIGLIRERIDTQIKEHKIGGFVDVSGGEKLKEGLGPTAREYIINLVSKEFKTFDTSNHSQVLSKIRDYTNLDPDLVTSIVVAQWTLKFAQQKQRERNAEVKTVPSAPPITPVDAQPTMPPIPTRQPTEPSQPPPVEKPVQPLRPEESAVDLITLDERRKQNNRERLNVLLDNMDARLNDIDLAPEDITENELRRLDRVIRKLGIWAFNHPNTPRIMREEYKRVSERLTELLEEQTHRRLEEDQKDTRTGR